MPRTTKLTISLSAVRIACGWAGLSKNQSRRVLRGIEFFDALGRRTQTRDDISRLRRELRAIERVLPALKDRASPQ